MLALTVFAIFDHFSSILFKCYILAICKSSSINIVAGRREIEQEAILPIRRQ